GQTIGFQNNTGTPACSLCYLSYDHLGSVRMVTDQNANVIARHDYLPYGEEIPANTAGRNGQWGLTTDVSQKFTGQFRDTETGIDFFNARYFGAAQGRFNSPDPMNAGADLSDPQTWNAYGYVRGNPLNATDPSGMSLCSTSDPNSIVCVQNDPSPANGDPDFNSSSGPSTSPDGWISFYNYSFYRLFGSSGSGGGASQIVGTPPKQQISPPKNGSCDAGVIGNFISKYVGGNTIVSGNITPNAPTVELGAAIGSLFGPEGTLPGALLGSMFGVGGSISYVPGTGSLYAGPVATFGVGISGGSGFSVSAAHVPSPQNANSIASGKSFSLSYQPNPFLGSAVTK